jgi:hypothetical protein
VRFAERREAMCRQHCPDLPERRWRDILPLRSGLQRDADQRELCSDVQKVDRRVLHSGPGEKR